MSDQTPDLGPCCACGATTRRVRNVMMLDQRAPIAGRGWGCVVCGLPSDGAVAVVCDDCLDRKTPLQFACRGWPAEDGRVPIGALVGVHQHDLDQHADDVDAGDPALWL